MRTTIVLGKLMAKDYDAKYRPFVFYKIANHYIIVETIDSPWPVCIFKGFHDLFGNRLHRVFHDVIETD
jgi:hypothetical protein